MVNYKWAIILFAGAILAVLGCEPTELPEPSDGDPVFRLEGRLDSAVFELGAGIDGYFMFTGLSPTNDGNLRSLSRLEELGCTSDCAPGWQFEFNGSTAALDSFLAPGQVPFQGPGTITIDTTYHLNLLASSTFTGGASVLSYEWSFFDGTTANTSAVEKEVSGPGLYEVELTTTTEEGCQSYTRKSFSVSSAAPECEVDFYIDSLSTLDSVITAFYIPGSADPQTLLWQDSIPGEAVAIFSDSFFEPYTLCLQATFEQGCTAVDCQTIMPMQSQTPGAVCSNDIEGGIVVDTNTTGITGISQGVVIRHRDEAGQRYASDYGPQGSSFFFEVEGVSPYERNSLGQSTLQLQVQFQCLLYDTEGQPWKEAVGTGVIAVAVPE
jgi:hypothetical protein